MKSFTKAFSLIEVVIALGIFSFCIVGIFGLLPVAMSSVQSVYNESNANNIAESIAGFWEVAPSGENSTAGGNFTMGSFTVGNPANETFYYNNDGNIVTDNTDASLKLNYAASSLSGYANSYTLNLTFTWPANAPDDSSTVTTRTFNYIFTK